MNQSDNLGGFKIVLGAVFDRFFGRTEPVTNIYNQNK